VSWQLPRRLPLVAARGLVGDGSLLGDGSPLGIGSLLGGSCVACFRLWREALLSVVWPGAGRRAETGRSVVGHTVAELRCDHAYHPDFYHPNFLKPCHILLSWPRRANGSPPAARATAAACDASRARTLSLGAVQHTVWRGAAAKRLAWRAAYLRRE
jgi:hypothetical protein